MHAKDLPKNNTSLNEFKLKAIKKIHDQKLTISALARMTGIKQSTLHKGLFEERELSFSNAHAIGNALDISLSGHGAAPGRMAPVLTHLSQLPSLHGPGLPIWDEYVLLQHAPGEAVLAIDRSLFRPALFPARAVVLVQTGERDGANLVYPHHDALCLGDNGKPPLGRIIGITFRKNQ
ncbi:helix-turn-helix domain-containing protein [Chromobacterium subtsugae]|uniref:helix-turn-helix domain-containing protein n=1 Tax=Chromobacterium subtsugae TaxID=251747 RepID=UPI000640CF34|nr:helix-turn-helix transcriptional regulator [Chromobacterium subtsugae]